MNEPVDIHVTPFDAWSSGIVALIQSALDIPLPEFDVSVRSDGSIWRLVEETPPSSEVRRPHLIAWITILSLGLVMAVISPVEPFLRIWFLLFLLLAAGIMMWVDAQARRAAEDVTGQRVFLANRQSVGKLFRSVGRSKDPALTQTILSEVFRLCRVNDALDVASREVNRRAVRCGDLDPEIGVRQVTQMLDQAWAILDDQAETVRLSAEKSISNP